VPKTLLAPPTVTIGSESFPVTIPSGQAWTPAEESAEPDDSPYDGETIDVPLLRLALARSGDKGDSANIAIIARDPAYLPVLRRELTSARVATHFAHLATGPVRRFEAPGLGAFNFLLHTALGGGGMASLRIDPQGKAYGQMALEMMIPVPVGLAG